MEHVEISENESLAQAVERANEICMEPIRCHWDGTLFNAYNKLPPEQCSSIDDLRFKLGFDHVELIDSLMEEAQSAQLIDGVGNLKTLSMIFTFRISDTKVNGKIRICSVLNQSALESIFRLHLTKIKVKSIVGLYVAEDSYRVDHVIHEFLDASISLVYKRDGQMIPVYNQIQDKYIKHSLVQYIVRNCTKNSISIIEGKLRSAFDLTSVSISLGNQFSLRDDFRVHVKKMKVAFNKLVDEIIDSTNSLLVEKAPKISLPNVSVILNFRKDVKKSFSACKSSTTGLNFLIRKKSATVHCEGDLVILYVPVDFADLNIQYKHYSVKYGDKESRISDIQEHYKTEGSYLIISIKKIGQTVDLNLLEFKINSFVLLDSDHQLFIDALLKSWIHNIFEFNVAPTIEETFEKFIRTVMGQKKFQSLALTGDMDS